jgi:Ca-activated chloride channel family protein
MVLLCAGGLAQTTPPPAQQPSTPPAAGKPAQPEQKASGDDPQFTQRVITNEVNLVFAVTDKHGRFIKDLTENQFKIFDNGKPVVPKGFQAQTNVPLRVGLLIDASNSIRDRFLFEQQAAIEFLQQVIRPERDQAFVLAFDEVPEVTQDFTSDQDKLTKGIKLIRPGGGTAMWDAVYTACRDHLMKHAEIDTVRRVIILVSDGDDNQSRVLRQEAIAMAQRADVIIYTISTNLSNIQDSGDKNLKMLADATGGQAFFPFKIQDLADDFYSIQGELRSQYTLHYKPEGIVAGQFRAVLIKPDDTKFRVRVKKGYYAR